MDYEIGVFILQVLSKIWCFFHQIPNSHINWLKHKHTYDLTWRMNPPHGIDGNIPPIKSNGCAEFSVTQFLAFCNIIYVTHSWTELIWLNSFVGCAKHLFTLNRMCLLGAWFFLRERISIKFMCLENWEKKNFDYFASNLLNLIWMPQN